MYWSYFVQTILWACAAGVFYVYFGYPLFVFIVGRLVPKPVRRADIEPNVTLIVTAYNEARDIRQKLENTLLIDYPKEKLEIIVVSDHSNDGTDAIVREFETRGVVLLRQPTRGGKTAAQNSAVEKASGEIIVFSDATSIYETRVLREMLPNFADASVGCVAGRLVYADTSGSGVGVGARSYWSFESFLKKSESAACSLIGASGCLYAVRRVAYKAMYPEACSDFLIATVVYRQGLRTVYEGNAVCIEETNRHATQEMRMRIRIISQTFTDLWRNREMMNPFRSGFFAVELISHKLLRYSVPLFLALMFICSGVLAFYSVFYLALFALQAAFYLWAVAAWVLVRSGIKAGILAIPLYFMLTNVASAAGFFQFLRGERYARWEPIRDAG